MRRKVGWLILGAIIAVAIGSWIPPVIISATTRLPLNNTWHYTGPDFQATIHSSAGPERGSIAVDAEITLGEIHALDSTVLFRDNAMPITDPVSHSEITTPEQHYKSPPSVRIGHTHFLPHTTERRSLPYFDLIAQETFALDYVGPTQINGIDAYIYSQTLEDIATELGSYSVDRTLVVEPNTGVIMDRTEILNVDSHTAALAFDESTKAQLRESVIPTLRLFRALQVIAWLAKTSAVILGLWAILTIARHRP